MRRNGFSIIELLIAVLIIGIIAAIAMGNYFNAVHRAKQKRTMADIRSIAVAWEARAVDVRQYNAAGVAMPPELIASTDLRQMLTPTYVRDFPASDGWGFPLEFRADAAVGSTNAAAGYSIRSPGRDGKYEGTNYAGNATTSYDCDIVYMSGQFVAWPEGVQGDK